MEREFLYENTWMIEDAGVRIFILKGTEKTLVIDTGRSGLDLRPVLQDDAPYELINTHADPDHMAGNCYFPTFYMHPSEAPVYYNLNHGTGNFIPVWDGDVIDLGNRPLEIVHIPGHTPGSISILDRTRRALIGGDPIQKHGRIYMFGIHRDLHSYIHGLKRVLARTDFDCIYPSHSDVCVDKTVIPGLMEGAERILTGTAVGKPINVHGHDVIAYEAGENVLLYDA